MIVGRTVETAFPSRSASARESASPVLRVEACPATASRVSRSRCSQAR